MLSTLCFYCNHELDTADLETWKQVVGWVGGPKKDNMSMRMNTGNYAHAACIHKAKLGQSPDQEDLFSS